MSPATLTILSKTYGSWSLRGWLMCKMAGLEFEERAPPADDPSARAELMLLSPSFLAPCLEHDGAKVWDTLAIGEYLAELKPEAGLLPTDRKVRAHCRSVCGEMHSGFSNLRAALPMNLRGHYPGYRVFSGARPDIERVTQIWRDCIDAYGGPFLFGEPTLADAMYAPVCSRFRTYDVALDEVSEGYCRTIMTWPLMVEWIGAAMKEDEEIEEFEVEF